MVCSSKMTTLEFCLWLMVLLATRASSERSNTEANIVDQLERSLLATFGLDERPKVDKREVVIPPYMFHLYNQKVRQNLEEEGDIDRTTSSKYLSRFSANTVRSFHHSESDQDRLYPAHQMHLYFNVTSVPSRESLEGAEVRILHFRHTAAVGSSPTVEKGSRRRKWTKEEKVYLQQVRAYDVLRPSDGDLPPAHRLLDSRVIDVRDSSALNLDVSATVKRWLSRPNSNHGIFVEVVPLLKNSSSKYEDGSHIRLRRDAAACGDDEKDWSKTQPLLIVHTDDPNIKPRQKRSPSASALKKIHSFCRRYSMYVDFRKVDWNTWIVAPPGYDAFFCQGTCPFPLAKHMNATNHAVIQTILHSRYPSRVPSACCVPIKHSAISMLYLDKDRKVVLKTYQDMIVESCGCQ